MVPTFPAAKKRKKTSLTARKGLTQHVCQIQDPSLKDGVNIWVLVRKTRAISVVALKLLSFQRRIDFFGDRYDVILPIGSQIFQYFAGNDS